MQQKWWLFAAGAIGIVLAVLLFPRPDTGVGISSTDPTSTQPLNFKEDPSEKRVLRRGAEGARLEARPTRRTIDKESAGANPVAAEVMKRRSQPEAIFAGRASGPWTMVRRQLMLMSGDPDAAAFAEELASLITDLRALRRDPGSGDFQALSAQQRELIGRVRSNAAWLDDEVLVSSLERVEAVLGEYDERDPEPSDQE